MPRRVKRKRPILLEDGTEAGGMEEYYDYIFPVGTSQRHGHSAEVAPTPPWCYCVWHVCLQGSIMYISDVL